MKLKGVYSELELFYNFNFCQLTISFNHFFDQVFDKKYNKEIFKKLLLFSFNIYFQSFAQKLRLCMGDYFSDKVAPRKIYFYEIPKCPHNCQSKIIH